jgi:hypothetical protein
MKRPRSAVHQRSTASFRAVSKDLLLPIPSECVRSLSLRGHLALVGSRAQEGNRDSVMQLTRIVYMTFFMRQISVGCTDDATFLAAEAALDKTVQAAQQTGQWHVDDDAVQAIEALLRLYDEELAAASAKTYFAAEKRLQRLLGSADAASPLRPQCAGSEARIATP